MRHLIVLAVVIAAGASACNREKKEQTISLRVETPTPAPTPALAARETVFVQLDVAIGAAVAPLDVLNGVLVAGGTAEDPWKPDAKGIPKMAASVPAIEGDVYVDEGFMSVALSGAVGFYEGWAGNELGAALASIAAKPGVAGAALYQLDDRNGGVVHVAAVAGRDLPEAMMSLVDLWAPELDIDYSATDAATVKQDGMPSRAGMISTLRKRKTLEAEIRRIQGVTIRKDGAVTVVGFPPGALDSSRALATRLVSDLGLLAAPAPE